MNNVNLSIRRSAGTNTYKTYYRQYARRVKFFGDSDGLIPNPVEGPPDVGRPSHPLPEQTSGGRKSGDTMWTEQGLHRADLLPHEYRVRNAETDECYGDQ
jgi:hypothetical protein